MSQNDESFRDLRQPGRAPSPLGPPTSTEANRKGWRVAATLTPPVLVPIVFCLAILASGLWLRW